MNRFSVLALGEKCRDLVEPAVELSGWWSGSVYSYVVTIRGRARDIPPGGFVFQAVSGDVVPDAAAWFEGPAYQSKLPVLEAGNDWWPVPIDSVPVTAVEWQVCDSDGKRRVFRDVGQAIEKIRRVLGVEAFSVAFVFVGERDVKLPADMNAAAAKRGVTLGKLMTAAQGRKVQVGAALGVMAGWGDDVGAKKDRFDEMTLRQRAIESDIVEVQRQMGNLPYIEATPDA